MKMASKTFKSPTDNGSYMSTLPANTDLDTYVNPGVYGMSSGYNYTNTPAQWGVLEIVSDRDGSTYGYKLQRITQVAASYCRLYMRYYNTGAKAWGEWFLVNGTKVR